MSYEEIRNRRAQDEVSTDVADYSWEEEQIPCLHSGLVETFEGSDGKGSLALSLYFQNGSYRARLHDRQRDEVAFTRVGSLGGFLLEIERQLLANELDWTPSRSRSNFR